MREGFTTEHLRSRKFGHKLNALWNACLTADVRSAPDADALIETVIQAIDPVATAHEIQYFKEEPRGLPELTDFEKAVRMLLATVRPLIPIAGP